MFKFENLFPKTSKQLNDELTRNIEGLKPVTPEEKKIDEEFNSLPNKSSKEMEKELDEAIKNEKN